MTPHKASGPKWLALCPECLSVFRNNLIKAITMSHRLNGRVGIDVDVLFEEVRSHSLQRVGRKSNTRVGSPRIPRGSTIKEPPLLTSLREVIRSVNTALVAAHDNEVVTIETLVVPECRSVLAILKALESSNAWILKLSGCPNYVVGAYSRGVRLNLKALRIFLDSVDIDLFADRKFKEISHLNEVLRILAPSRMLHLKAVGWRDSDCD